MLNIFHCKCCNLKQFALKFPKIFRSKIYSDAYEIIFKKTCKKCEQTNLHLEKLATQTFELRWKEISDLEEQQIIMEQELRRIEKTLNTKKENKNLTKNEEKWFNDKLQETKNKLNDDINTIKAKIRSTIAVKLKNETANSHQ